MNDLPAEKVADGSSNWVDSLVSGCASQRKIPGSALARARVPRPTAKLSVFRAPALPSRKLQADILKATKEYEREQYVRLSPLPDGAAERAEAQLLFEHGRKGLQEMKALEKQRREQAALTEFREPDSQDIREELVQQVPGLLPIVRNAHFTFSGSSAYVQRQRTNVVGFTMTFV